MNRTAGRAAAIVLGVTMAAGLCLGVRAIQARDQELPRWWLPLGGALRIGEPPSSCPRFSAGLSVRSEAIGEDIEPLAWEEAGAHGKTAVAAYSGHWAETRQVTFVGEDWTKAILVQVAYRTDYGNYTGLVDSEESSLHRHDDVVCFDLSVRRCDGSGTLERWQGEVRLRE